MPDKHTYLPNLAYADRWMDRRRIDRKETFRTKLDFSLPPGSHIHPSPTCYAECVYILRKSGCTVGGEHEITLLKYSTENVP